MGLVGFDLEIVLVEIRNLHQCPDKGEHVRNFTIGASTTVERHELAALRDLDQQMNIP